MLVTGYRTELFRPKCNPSFQSLHCYAHLDTDVREVLPYLNAALGGDVYVTDPPSVTFKAHGKLITVHARKIAVNALRDAEEAEKILEWLVREINETWERREQITPSFHGRSKPQVIEVYKRLPRTNCRKCGQVTCLVFAALASDGAKGPGDCPELTDEQRDSLTSYLEPYVFD